MSVRKKKQNKILIVLILIVISFNLIISSNVFAAPTEEGTTSSGLEADLEEGNKQFEVIKKQLHY